MIKKEIPPELVWITLLPKHGAIVRIFLSYLKENKDFIEEIRLAIDNIGIETSIGPLLDPSAYLDSKRFENANKCKVILSGLITLAKALK